MRFSLKILIGLLVISYWLLVPNTYAATNKFITIVNPVRGGDFWELQNTNPKDNVEKSWNQVKLKQLPATWLIRPDALSDSELVGLLKSFSGNQELGLLMEITPTWATMANVRYNSSENWHFAKSIFLTGYSVEDRKKLIDNGFEKFKQTFGYYPKSVGAWWIDAGSLTYMKEKYGIVANLDVADQYSTDNYQVWGQYFSTPFYPSKRNALIPALGEDQKIGVLTLQWATRDPFNSYGNGVLDSTYSVQANDYANKKFHDLNINYFKKLLAIYLDNSLSPFGQVTVGLENDFSWGLFGEEFTNQLEVVRERRQTGTQVLTMSDFARKYASSYNLSPPQIVFGKDPLGSDGLVVWYQTSKYRVGWFYTREGSMIRDLRLFTNAQSEPCLEKRCEALNLALTETRNIDEVTYGDRWVVDEGKITNFNLRQIENGIEISYLNQANQKRSLVFVDNDVITDGSALTLASTIAKVTSEPLQQKVQNNFSNKLENPKGVVVGQLKGFGLFAIFALFCFYLPGLMLTKKLNLEKNIKFILAWPVGICLFTLTAFILGFFNFYWGLLILPIVAIAFIKKDLNLPRFSWFSDKLGIFLVLIGSLSWLATTVKNGLLFDFGLGFWGAHGHDSFWHLSLIEGIKNGLPLQNPIFADKALTNYHYFYDLLLAATSTITFLPSIDLYFRYFPILITLLIGTLAYVLAKAWFNSRMAASIAVFLIYFGGSFGWMVSYFKNRTLGGESLFWAQQGISTFINPPFAISILLFLAGLYLFNKMLGQKNSLAFIIPLTLLWGTLIEFKAYAGLLVLGALAVVTAVEIFKRNFEFLKISLPIALLSILVFLPNNLGSQSLLVFSPFWLIHSMVDSPDRLGWYRLQLARMAGGESGNWFKFFVAEIIGVIVFILGNLGTRVVGLLSINKLFPLTSFSLFIISFLSLTLVIPLLFVQIGGPFNIVQFFYYFLIVSSFLAAVSVARLGIVVVVILIILTIPTTWDTLHHYLPERPPARISKEELEALNFLKTKDQGVVLSFYDKKLRDKFSEPVPVMAYETTAYVSALSGKNEFLADLVNQEILGVDYKGRLQLTRDILAQREPELISKMLKENNIRYIYAPKVFHFQPNPEEYNLTNIFENSEVDIFKVN
jgi:hypothetical protein